MVTLLFEGICRKDLDHFIVHSNAFKDCFAIIITLLGIPCLHSNDLLLEKFHLIPPADCF